MYIRARTQELTLAAAVIAEKVYSRPDDMVESRTAVITPGVDINLGMWADENDTSRHTAEEK